MGGHPSVSLASIDILDRAGRNCPEKRGQNQTGNLFLSAKCPLRLQKMNRARTPGLASPEGFPTQVPGTSQRHRVGVLEGGREQLLPFLPSGGWQAPIISGPSNPPLPRRRTGVLPRALGPGRGAGLRREQEGTSEIGHRGMSN